MKFKAPRAICIKCGYHNCVCTERLEFHRTLDPRPEGVYLRWIENGLLLEIQRVNGDQSVTTSIFARDPEAYTIRNWLATELPSSWGNIEMDGNNICHQ